MQCAKKSSKTNYSQEITQQQPAFQESCFLSVYLTSALSVFSTVSALMKPERILQALMTHVHNNIFPAPSVG